MKTFTEKKGFTWGEKISLLHKLKDFYENLEQKEYAVKAEPFEAILKTIKEKFGGNEPNGKDLHNFLVNFAEGATKNKKNYSGKFLEFYYGGIGAAIGVLKDVKKIIDGSINLMTNYKKLEEKKV